MRTLLFVLTTLFIFSSCEDSDILSAKMNANIDGTAWSTTLRATVLQNNTFIITGTSITGEVLILSIHGDSVGNYTLNADDTEADAECWAVYKESASTSTDDAWLSYTGFIDLDEINTSNKTISGEFNFTVAKGLTATMGITGGTFTDLKYTITSN